MIAEDIVEDFDEPPAKLDFKLTVGGIFVKLWPWLEPRTMTKDQARELNTELFLVAPGLVSATIDYQIENPTALPRYLLPEAITILRGMYAENHLILNEIDIAKKMPAKLMTRTYENKRDKYSWRATDPEKIRRLQQMLGKFRPDVIVGSAHGGIRPATLLSLMMGTRNYSPDLYFIRVSRFKREDRQAAITPNDQQNLEEMCRGKKVLCFDEDTISGDTLTRLATSVQQFGPAQLRTASVVSYTGAKVPEGHVAAHYFSE